MQSEFLIVKYYDEAVIGTLGTQRAYLKVYARPARRKKSIDRQFKYETCFVRITRDEALSLIKESGLELSLSTKEGKVWDTPNKGFMKRYKGKISILDL